MASALHHDAPALRIEGLAAGYGGTRVLRGVDLTIRPGEAHCLLGSNGAGKTTLIRTVLGRVRPSEGRIRHRGLGLVPQEIALYPLLTVAENLAAFARLAGVPRRRVRARVAETARATGLTARMRQRVGTLSGGWQRRVNIASAILHEPALLILDEPTVGIDAAARETLHEMIRGLVANGLGLLLVTHDIAEAEALCSHAVLLHAGQVAAAGRIRDLTAARFGGALALTVAAEGPLERHGFDLSSGRPVKLVADGPAGLAEVARLRAAGVRVSGLGLERPGLDLLRHAVLAEGARPETAPRAEAAA